MNNLVPATESAGQERLVTCRIGGRLYGVDLEKARDMVVLSSVTPIPFAPERVRGAVNLNNRMATVIDVRSVLGLPPNETHSIVGLTVEHDGHAYVLAVDEVGDIAGTADAREPIERLDVGAIVAPT